MRAQPRRRKFVPPIRTARLVLREFTPADEADVVAYSSDPQVTHHLLHGQRNARAAALHLATVLRQQRARTRTAWELAVTLAGDGQFVGACDLTLVAQHEAVIGYLLRPAHWRRGYGTEVAEALVQTAFDRLGVSRVSSMVAVDNERSARVLTRAGLRWEAMLRRYGRIGHRWLDVHVYALERELWERSRA
jgi:ribosomal-protein-alanine N-acetyltransferase